MVKRTLILSLAGALCALSATSSFAGDSAPAAPTAVTAPLAQLPGVDLSAIAEAQEKVEAVIEELRSSGDLTDEGKAKLEQVLSEVHKSLSAVPDSALRFYEFGKGGGTERYQQSLSPEAISKLYSQSQAVTIDSQRLAELQSLDGLKGLAELKNLGDPANSEQLEKLSELKGQLFAAPGVDGQQFYVPQISGEQKEQLRSIVDRLKSDPNGPEAAKISQELLEQLKGMKVLPPNGTEQLNPNVHVLAPQVDAEQLQQLLEAVPQDLDLKLQNGWQGDLNELTSQIQELVQQFIQEHQEDQANSDTAAPANP